MEKNEQLFYDKLRDIFMEAKVEINSGYNVKYYKPWNHPIKVKLIILRQFNIYAQGKDHL